MSTCPAEQRNPHVAGRTATPEALALQRDVYLGLQLCRANSLSLTRLQIALNQGDRHLTLEAIDKLHELDSQADRLLRNFPAVISDDPELRAMGKYVDQQNMAVAFEKLSLVSEVSGPAMMSSSHWRDSNAKVEVFPEVSLEPRIRRTSIAASVLGFVFSLGIFVALVIAAAYALAG